MLDTQQLAIDIAYRKQLTYLLHVPPYYDGKTPQPLLIFLHGSGERGPKADHLTKFGPAQRITQGDDLPFIVLTPQCPAHERWEQNMREVLQLIDHVQANYAVDPARVYLTGFSMGAYGAWVLAWHHRERFAALATVANGLQAADIALAVPTLKTLPCWVFHGEQDAAIPMKKSTEMVKALKTVGGDVKLTLYPDCGHEAPTFTYNDPELYAWFLRQTHHAG